MPRCSAVSVTNAVACIKTYMKYFCTKDFPPYTSDAWKQISTALGGKWNAHNVYINVREDRRSILSMARTEMGIKTDQLEKAHIYDLSFDDDSALNDSTVPNNKLSSSFSDETSNQQIIELDLFITREEWDKIKPDSTIKYGSREKLILKPRVWTNVIYETFWKQHRLPCAFSFKRADVSLTSDKPMYNLKIKGRCTDKDCLNTFVGTATVDPDNDGFTIHVQTRDTLFSKHNQVKRQLNGEHRKHAQQEMIAEGCAMWIKRKARELMKPGDPEPPCMPNDDVCRQAKTEGSNANLDVKKKDARDLIRTIEEMSGTKEYSGIIRHVSSLPFVAIYCAAAQMYAYKQFCRLQRHSAVISLDSTGSLVQKLDRSDGRGSGHIFLYSIVINFEKKTLPVHQMLSETQETEFIVLWLWQWLRIGAKKPKEAVCDYSRALLLAVCTALNNQTTKSYINTCFAIIMKRDVVIEKPSTYIRIDVAHLIHLVCRWKCFDKISHVCIKDFFIRCVSLLAECQTHTKLEEIFRLTCIVGLQTHDDAEIDVSPVRTTKDARKILEAFIAFRGEQHLRECEKEVEIKEQKYQEQFEKTGIKDFLDNPLDSEEIILTNCKVVAKWNKDPTTSEPIVQWVRGQLTKAKRQISADGNLNPYYLPDFIQTLSQLMKEYPLWTAVAMPYEAPHATSSFVEGYFNDVKTRVLKNSRTPMRVDKFIKTHALDITGGTLLFSSKMINWMSKFKDPNLIPIDDTKKELNHVHLADLQILPTPTHAKTTCDDSDIMSRENWRNKGQKPFPEDNTLNESQSFAFDCNNNKMVKIAMNASPNSSDFTVNINEFMDFVADHGHSSLINDVPTGVDIAAGFDNSQEYSERNAGKRGIESNASMNADDSVSVDLYSLSDHSYCKTAELCISHNLLKSTKRADVNSLQNPVGQICARNVQQNLDDETALCAPNILPPSNPGARKPSKYFAAYPEIRQQNLLVSKRNTAFILPNGNICHKPINIDGEIFFVRNTCGFDSIVHILMTGSLDRSYYAAVLQETENCTLKLVMQLMNDGVKADLFRKRAAILKTWCPIKANEETANRILSYTIEAEDSIGNIVTNIFQLAPSIYKRGECSHCSGRTYSCALISPNHNTIQKEGFGALEKALNFREFIYKINCKNCVGHYTLYSNPSFHLFIELDIRSTTKSGLSTKGLECKLSQFPVTLRLRQMNKSHIEYCLVGVVGYMNGHFVAHCRRSTGVWEWYDDLRQKKQIWPSNRNIEPHLVIYIRASEV